MEIGEVWAYREKPKTPGTPVSRVEVVQYGPVDRRPRSVRVRWLEGEYRGLDEWVNQSRLVVPWADVDVLLDAERQRAELVESIDDPDEVLIDATQFVLDSVEEGRSTGVMMGWSGTYGLAIAYKLDEVPDAVRQELLDAPKSYVDNRGTYYGPWPVGVGVARRVCAEAPRAVLVESERHEEAYRSAVITGFRGMHRSGGYPVDRSDAEQDLAAEQRVLAVVREWCGEAEREQWDQVVELRNEVTRLQELVLAAAERLKAAGHPQLTARFRREVERRRSEA